MGETYRKREHERERGWKKVEEVGREYKRGRWNIVEESIREWKRGETWIERKKEAKGESVGNLETQMQIIDLPIGYVSLAPLVIPKLPHCLTAAKSSSICLSVYHYH